MKANEAPEKIYLNQDDGLICHRRSYKDDIEYTRTNAFIVKAENWLINNTEITPTGIKNFRKAMKGE